MTLWRLEWLRLLRTRRLLLLIGLQVFFGVLGAGTARYGAAVLSRARGEDVILSIGTPGYAFGQFVNNAQQVGLLVGIAVAAGSLSIHSVPERAVFLRTRVGSAWRLIAPRYAVASLALLVAFTAGAISAIIATTILLGPLPAARVVAGVLLGSVYLAFAVAVTTMAAGVTSNVVGALIGSVLVLLALPILSLVPKAGPWVPSRLAGAPDAIVKGVGVGAFVAPAVSAVIVGAAFVAIGTWATSRREV